MRKALQESLLTNGKTIWKYVGQFLKQCIPRKRQVLSYFLNPKQEAHVSVHSERTLNWLAWWSGDCSLHYYRRDQSSGLQLQPFILGQRIWQHHQGSAIPCTHVKRKRKNALHHSMLMLVPIPNNAQSVRMFQLRLTKCFSAGIENHSNRKEIETWIGV